MSRLAFFAAGLIAGIVLSRNQLRGPMGYTGPPGQAGEMGPKGDSWYTTTKPMPYTQTPEYGYIRRATRGGFSG